MMNINDISHSHLLLLTLIYRFNIYGLELPLRGGGVLVGMGLSEQNPLVRCVITHISRIMATYRAWEDWTECDFATVRSGLDSWQLQNRAISNHLFISLSLFL